MKSIDIALKDMLQSFRSLFAVMFMFVIPILMTGMFSLMFGSPDENEAEFVLPITRVILVNQDEGSFPEHMPGETPNTEEHAKIEFRGRCQNRCRQPGSRGGSHPTQ
jgi:hypothetical protein